MSTIETPNFREMDIGKLRQVAKHLRLAVPKTSTKDDMISAIEAKLAGKTMPDLAEAGTVLKPGYARIKLLEDPMPGASNSPAYVNINGYQATLPRGVEIVVPLRVVRALNDAVVNKRRQTMVAGAHGREEFRETTVKVPSFPFQILDMSPGPDPLTALEQSKKKIMAPRRRYRAMFGRWPRPKDLTRAIEQGLISMNTDEDFGAGVEAILDSTQED